MTSWRNVLMPVAMTFATDGRVRREGGALARHGFCVQALSWDRQGLRPSTESVDHCLVRNIGFGKTSALPYSRLYYALAAVFFQAGIFLWAVNRIRKAHELILHSHDFNTLLGCVAAKRVLKNRVLLVYDCHELTPGVYQEWYGSFIAAIVARLEFSALREVDAIITANEAIRRYLQRASNAPSVVVHNCPSVDDVPKLGLMDAKKKCDLQDSFVVLFTGKVRQDYDFSMILDAARDLRQKRMSGFKFVFVGLSELMAPLVKTVIDEGLQDFFDFRGYVSNEDWLAYYVASDLCFAVTRDLGPNSRILTPNKIFESMACGVPVVVREGTLSAEIVRSLRCGIVLDAGHTSLSAELIRLSQNREMLHALGAAGRRAFRLRYNWDAMQNRLLQLYAEILIPRPPQGK